VSVLPATAKASVGQGSTAARGALRPRGARRGHPGLHRSSPRGAPAAQPGDHGGAAEFQRRRRGFRAGKGMGRRRSRGSSPCSRIRRRWTGSRRSTAGGGARREHQWRPVMAARFRTGNGTAELGKSWNRCGARRSGLGCEESSGGGGVWPVRRRRRHCSTRLRPSSRRTKGGENGIGHRDWISTARAVVESNGTVTRRHKHREWRRAAPSRRETEREGRDERDMRAVS